MKKRARLEEGGINMTPMIDVVFQLIIFFITAVDMQNKALEMQIRLSMAPHGPPVEQQDPRTIFVDVDVQGNAFIARRQFSLGALRAILTKAVAEYGSTLPVVIRGDADTRHEYIRRVMDVCTQAGLYKVKFAAIKESAS